MDNRPTGPPAIRPRATPPLRRRDGPRRCRSGMSCARNMGRCLTWGGAPCWYRPGLWPWAWRGWPAPRARPQTSLGQRPRHRHANPARAEGPFHDLAPPRTRRPGPPFETVDHLLPCAALTSQGLLPVFRWFLPRQPHCPALRTFPDVPNAAGKCEPGYPCLRERNHSIQPRTENRSRKQRKNRQKKETKITCVGAAPN